ncbi:unnamed protein product [Urochloa humidicola]
MKPATVALLILVNMMFTYFGHASSHETDAAETTLLSNSYGSNDESSFAGGMTLGRKLLVAETSINSAAVSTDSSRSVSINWYNDFISHPPRRP